MEWKCVAGDGYVGFGVFCWFFFFLFNLSRLRVCYSVIKNVTELPE